MSCPDDPTREHDCPGDDVACEALEQEADDQRRSFLKTGLVAGAAAATAVACKKKGGADGAKKQPPGGRAEAPPPKRPAPRRTPAAPARTPAAPPERPRPRRQPAGPKKSRVVQVVNDKAYDAKGKPASKPVKLMVDTAVMELTGKKTPKEAWSSLFKPTEKVGLKPNCLGRHLCWPHAATVDAIIEGLVLAGVKHENMYMWDMWGFGASPLSRRYRNSKMKVKGVKAWGFGRKRFKIPSGPAVQLAKPLLAVDAVVNIPVIKDHDLTGVTCSMKNMALGSVPKPAIYHANRKGVRMCDPMVPEIYALPEVKDKVRLILTDAFNIIIDGGPKGNQRGLRKLHSVFAAVDPVAMDKVAWQIIDEQRVKANLPKLMDKPLAKVRPRGRPIYIATAEKLGLGTADPKRIDHVVKKLG